MLAERIDALRGAIVAGRLAEAEAIATEIEAGAGGWSRPDPQTLSRALTLLQATVAGLRAAAERLDRLRGVSRVYDAKGRQQSHPAGTLPARRW